MTHRHLFLEKNALFAPLTLEKKKARAHETRLAGLHATLSLWAMR
jgi:hypothetical protein